MEERPGAVHLVLPEDVAEKEAGERILKVVGHRRPDANQKCLIHAAKMIEEAKCPLLLIGSGANTKTTFFHERRKTKSNSY